MSDYKFVTREEIEEAHLNSDDDLYSLASRLLSERDAYREVAIQEWGYPHMVDAEAARIVEGKP